MYNRLLNQLATARDPEAGKPWGRGHHTRLFKQGENVAVVMHGHQIATVRPDDSVILDSCGWRTVTTKDRINEVLAGTGWCVRQEKKEWWIVWRRNWNAPYVWRDGVILFEDGNIERHGDHLDLDAYRRKSKAIKAYAKTYVRKLAAGDLQTSAGDCFFCQAGALDGHVWTHVMESYYFGSLIVAVAKDPLYGKKMSQAARWRLSSLLNGEQSGDFGNFLDRQIERALLAALEHYCA